MHLSKPYYVILLILFWSLLLAACAPALGQSMVSATITATKNSTATLQSPPTNTPTIQPTSTATTTPIPPTPTATATPTQNLIYNEPGRIDAPILLYHHVEGDTSNSRYTVSVPNFKAQIQALHEMGYTAIPISLFLDALLDGAEIPESPVVITFDDGHESVYENAFPIMNAYDFPGVFYIVANRLNGVEDFVDVPELREMIAAGWEIGSHSYSHVDLTKNHEGVSREIAESKSILENALSIQVETFAYPFGTIDSFLAQKVSDYRYRAGMGLGTRSTHTRNNLFYLERIEIYGDYSLEEFKALLSSD